MMESVTREVSALEHCRSVEIGRCSRAAGVVGLAAPCKSDMTLGFSQSRLTDPRDSLARRTSTEYLLDRPDLSCAEVSGRSNMVRSTSRSTPAAEPKGEVDAGEAPWVVSVGTGFHPLLQIWSACASGDPYTTRPFVIQQAGLYRPASLHDECRRFSNLLR